MEKGKKTKHTVFLDYIVQKGVGGQVTVKETAEVTGALGGVSAVWVIRAVEAGLLEQNPKTYTIVRIPSSENMEFLKKSLFQKLLELRKEEERLIAEIREILVEHPSGILSGLPEE